MIENLTTKTVNILQKMLGITVEPTEASTAQKSKSQTSAVVLKEKKNSVQIMCWECKTQLWVKKGSHCHNIGLCSRCIGFFDSKTETVIRD